MLKVLLQILISCIVGLFCVIFSVMHCLNGDNLSLYGMIGSCFIYLVNAFWAIYPFSVNKVNIKKIQNGVHLVKYEDGD